MRIVTPRPAMTPKNDRDLLATIDTLPEPRHLFVLPGWLDSATLDRLIERGCVTCSHTQRDESGLIHLAMGLSLTAKGKRLSSPEPEWRRLMLKGSLAGASFAVMSVVILYLG